jgi:TRAP-type mannitol/chloroaromatic compound transport system substrate-binding protein
VESFDAGDRQLSRFALLTNMRALSRRANNAISLRKLREEGKVKILKFDDALLKALYGISKDVIAQAGSGDALSKKIYASYQQFRTTIMDWSDISERAYLNSRALA